jgi:hypothetical protein
MRSALDHTPLDPTRLSPAAQKALAPGATRMMAARGLVPLPRAGELLSVLYQLALEVDASLAQAARSSAEALPEKILADALADAALDPRVLDWIAPRCVPAPVLFDALVAAPAIADETVASLAAVGDARAIDLIATNEQRLLRSPAIIAAMYNNARARMSTVDRAVELAIHNKVRVDGIAAWDELVKILQAGGGSGVDDEAFAQAVAGLAEVDVTPLTTGDAEAAQLGPDGEVLQVTAPTVDDKKVPISKLNVAGKIRLATVGNAAARALLVRDPMKMVAVAAIQAQGVTDIEAARYAGNAGLCDDVIRYIASRREWTRLYGVKVSLIMNPKTPLPEVARMLPHLRDKDLRNVAKSKGIPSAVAAQARKLISQRTPGAKK